MLIITVNNYNMNTSIKKFYAKIKDSFQTAVVAAFIVLMVILLLYIPFKVIPKIMTSGTSLVATTISSIFIPDNNDNTEEVVATTTTKTNTVKNTVTNNSVSKTETKTSAYYGKADLAISLIGTGIINKSTGQFYQTNYAGSNDVVGVKFEVRNIGTNISGIWRLRLSMPSKTTPTYDSDYQISLRPGDRIEYVASFEKPLSIGINTGYVVADYFNNVDELTKTNNYLTVPIRIESSNITDNDIDTDYNNNSLRITCGVNNENPRIGNIVTWSANVTGGSGQYLYSWQGSDDLLSIQSPYNGVNKVYYNSGTKTAKVIVYVNGQTISKSCGSISVR